MKKSKIRAVCFDMWGTLCEGGGGKEWFLLQRILGANSIDNKIFHNLGLESLLLHPWSLRDGIKNLTKKLTDIKPLSSSVILSDSDVTSGESKDLIIEKAYSTWWNLVEKSRIYPETYEVLDKLEQYSLKLFIISNTDSESFYYEVNKFNLKKNLRNSSFQQKLAVLNIKEKCLLLSRNICIYLKIEFCWLTIHLIMESYQLENLVGRPYGSPEEKREKIVVKLRT